VSEYDCRKCKDWKTCYWQGVDISNCWFGYQDIRWCSLQVCWLLKYSDYLHEGKWPTPDSTVAGGMRGKQTTEASYAKVMLVIAELDTRLEKTGWRGKLLIEECKNREKLEYLSKDARDALYYVVGWRRKDRSFQAWLKDRRYRKKAIKVS
jgi:hypothetical protein